MSDFIGKSFGRYHILEQLGEGGMAIVFKAFDTRLERDVAIKIIRKGAFPADHVDHILKRFEREAKALARLSHPNIVKVHDFGEHDGYPFLVMEYLPSGTLKQRMGKPIPWQEAIQLLMPIAEALDYAHSQNMIHRDVKPSNILLTDRGQPMLTDFGIAKVLDLEETIDLTGTSAAVGTPEYMAPEQATARTADHRADIYALGVVLYEMVTGRKPFIADTPMAVLIKHATEPLPRPKQFVSNLPDAVENVLLKALAKNPEDRYQSMAELVASIERLLGSDKQIIEKSSKEKPEFIPEKKKDKPVTVRSGTGVRPIYWIGGLVVLVLGILLFSVLNRPTQLIDPTVEVDPTFVDVPIPPALPTEITDAKGVPMVLIPAGEFMMGSDEDADTRPVHAVFLDSYYIDKFEVTNLNYQNCVADGSCQTPNIYGNSYTGFKYYGKTEYSNHPVINVTWPMANEYCEWRSGKLPSEAQWEKAARGLDQRLYSWGNNFDCHNGNFGGNCDEYPFTSPVGFFSGDLSPFGVYDMTGNVKEWISDWYNASYYANSPYANPSGPSSGEYHVMRGNSFLHETPSHLAYRAAFGDSNMGDFGFRCVLPVFTDSQDSATETLTPLPQTNAFPTEITDEKGVSMVLVPAGEFTMGSEVLDHEKPIHKVYLDAFYMDVYEVTNALYIECVDAGGCTPPRSASSLKRSSYYGNLQYADYPVQNVDWYQSQAYCEWRDAGLPTEAQWEKAARGTDGRTYPWGEGIDCSKANYWGTDGGCVGDTTKVGSYESGKSPFGIYDLAGNAWEWVADWYESSYYMNSPLSNPLGPSLGLARVGRGGAWNDYESNVRSSYRLYINPDDIFAGLLGFRCARAVETHFLTGVSTPDPLPSPAQTLASITFSPDQSSSASGLWIEINSEISGSTATEICQSKGFALATQARKCDGAIYIFPDEYSHSNCPAGSTKYQDCYNFSSCTGHLPNTVVFEALYCE